MFVTVTDLQQRLATTHDLEVSKARQIIDTLFTEISTALAAGHKVRLEGFGQFAIRHRGARATRHTDGSQRQTEGSYVPQFKPATRLKETVNASAGLGDPKTP